MKKDRKVTLGLLGGALLTVVSLLSATAGSLAWYAYSRSVLFSYVGTSVQSSLLLNMGLVDNDNCITDATITREGLVRETHGTDSIVFTQSKNGLELNVIQEYLRNSHHAVNMLFPVTTKDRAIDATSGIILYKSPEYGDTGILTRAGTNEFVELPFVFKIADESHHALPNKEVWLTESITRTNGENIDQAVRIFIENSQRKFLVKPAESATQTGETKVGGLLDLDGDGTYDYDKLHGGDEYFYGENDGTIQNNTSYYDVPFDTAPFDNVNGVTDEVASTFYAKHNEGAKTVISSTINPKVAQYETFGTVNPCVAENGDYYAGETGIPVCVTGDDGLGYSKLTIFIEGWDHAVVDKEAGYSFDLGLRFETNRI